MEAERESKATLVDLLDRILDKGVIVNADAIVSLAGIPLIAIQLNALVASVETMLSYGMWHDWDSAIRASARENHRQNAGLLPFSQNDDEILISEFPGSYWYSNGISGTWKSGKIRLTDKRILHYRARPPEMFMDIKHEDIISVRINEEADRGNINARHIDIRLKNGRTVNIIASEIMLKKGFSDLTTTPD